jgi:phosphoadenosine phosphosulfate reductase
LVSSEARSASRAALPAAPETLAARMENARPQRIVELALRLAPDRVAVVSSFGAESAALLKVVADVDRTLPILFLDTLWLFKETLAYRDRLAAHLGLTDVRTITPSPSALARQDPRNDLCFTDPETCCALRKVAPLDEALAPFDAWINGRKRHQGGERGRLPVVETDGARLKFNPLARMSAAEIAALFASAGLPRHPLEARGFGSLGCIPCTSRTPQGGDARAGRWSGLSKTECGIHHRLQSAPRG